MALDRLTMDTQCACKRFNRREQTLLQAGDEQSGGGLLPFGFTAQPLFSKATILVQQRGKLQFRRICRKAINVDLDDTSLRKTADNFANVVLQAANHHRFEHRLLCRNPAAKTLRVKNFEQSREAV